MKKCITKTVVTIALIVAVLGNVMTAYAAPVTLEDGTVFDSDYYADTYPDLKAAFGYDYNALLQHYLTYGKAEGRIPSDGSVQSAQAVATQTLVPIDKLENLKSLKKKCTDEEFQEAYNTAMYIVTPLIGLSTEEQLYGIASTLRYLVDCGAVGYSTSETHYNDPYGYLVLGVSSCAGCTRTTGLCLNMLGISYEHVNENQWSHQWCRVNVNGTYWICDAYGLYVGPEPAPYEHPYF
jgi:hypothetical protein